MLIYNHRSARKIPILGKHTKRITSGAWSEQNLLALVGDDRLLTVSNEEGDTICQSSLKGDGAVVQFSSAKLDERSLGRNTDNCVSLILNKKNLLLLNLSDPENPIIMAFQERYGFIIDYHWHNEGQILLGFSNGMFIVISTYYKELGQELTQVKAHKESLTSLCVCMTSKKLATCSENTLVSSFTFDKNFATLSIKKIFFTKENLKK